MPSLEQKAPFHWNPRAATNRRGAMAEDVAAYRTYPVMANSEFDDELRVSCWKTLHYLFPPANSVAYCSGPGDHCSDLIWYSAHTSVPG